jgi:hypothetical protein
MDLDDQATRRRTYQQIREALTSAPVIIVVIPPPPGSLIPADGCGPGAGNFALGFVVGAGWYVFPLIVRLVRRLSGQRSPRATRATVVLSIFAALGAVAIAAFPNRYGGAYNEALDDQVPGFSAGIFAGSVPLLILGLVIWIGSKVLAWRARRDRERQQRIDDSRD